MTASGRVAEALPGRAPLKFVRVIFELTWELRPVSVLDTTWSSRSTWGDVGVILVDPVETILQRLSVLYLDEARVRCLTLLEQTPRLSRVPQLLVTRDVEQAC